MNIYIAGLSRSVDDAGLEQLFAEFGEISSAKVIMDKYTGGSRGFGFVEMPNDEDAKKAIEALDGIQHDGRTLAVNVAKPREDRPRNNYGRDNNYRR